MLYNKPRDVKLRVLPSLSSIVKKADAFKSKLSKSGKDNDADKLILLKNAVPAIDTDTADAVVPQILEKPSDDDFSQSRAQEIDIILQDPPRQSESDDAIIDLTKMPVIEGVPILALPDKPRKVPPELAEVTAAQKEKSNSNEHRTYSSTVNSHEGIKAIPTKPDSETPNDTVIDLTDLPDVDGIPMLELKPVDEEKIRLLEDFVYEPSPKSYHSRGTLPPRPDIDFDEPTYENSQKRSIRQIIAENRIETTADETGDKTVPNLQEIPKEAEARNTSTDIFKEPEVYGNVTDIPEEAAFENPKESEGTPEKLQSETEEASIDESVSVKTDSPASPLAQPKHKKGRKAKKKSAQHKPKTNVSANTEVIPTECVTEKVPEVSPSPKEKKQKSSKPVITDKRRYIKKKYVKFKLSIKKRIEQTAESKKKNKVRYTKSHKLKIASFFAVLYFGTVLAFAIPLRPTYSETEKRALAEFPEFSAKSLLKGDYFSDIDTWFSDTFPFREKLTQADTFIKNLYGIDSITIHGDTDIGDEIPDIIPEELPDEVPEEPKETQPVTMPDDDELGKDNGNPNAEKPDIELKSLGAIVVADDSAYEYYSFSQDIAPRFIGCVNRLDDLAKPTGNVYSMIIPTSMDITLNDALRADVNSANQKKALDYFNASFKNTVAVDTIYNAELKHRDEYIYFRTDHHWTALGAYYAYEEFAQKKDIQPVPLSKYKTKTFDNFIGTFYASSGQNQALKKNPDYVTAYLPFNNVSCQISDSATYEGFKWDVITDVSDYDASSKYLTFIGGDNGITTITNHDLPKGETCLVITESYGNAFVPFLIPHYSKVYVIDPRHFNGTLSNFANGRKIDDVIFLTNISTTRNYIFLEALENFVQ